MSESSPASKSASSLLTRCPNCETQFRVTDEQLGVANGKVRCGNCMKIFNAIEHRTTSGTTAAPTKADAPAGEDAGASGFTADDDFVFQDNPEEDADERGYTGGSLSFSDDELSDSFRSIEEGSITGFESDDLEEQQEDVDESWAEAMLRDDPGSKAAKPEAEPEPEHKPEPTPAPEPKRQSAPASTPTSEPQPTANAAESAASETPADEFSLQEHQVSDDPWALEGLEQESFSAENERPTYKSDKAFQDLGHEPIAVSGKKRRGWLRTTVWTLVVLGLLGVLGAQVGHYQFDRLSAMPELRPYYEMACEYTGCELKPLVDVDSIQSRKLVVRTDPENRSALVVDAEIINRALFEQPFPAIALTFSNLNGDVVAQSVFTPDTYLAGEARELDAMPKGVPVRIAVKIRDPGRDAVNYNIAFRPYAP